MKNVGSGTLYNVTITDTFVADATSITPPGGGSDNVRTYNVGDLAGNTCKRWPSGLVVVCDDVNDVGITFGTFESASNGGQLDSATAAAAFLPGGTPGDVTAPAATATCNTNSVVPTLTVSKSCTTSTTTSLVTTVNFDGDVCNQSQYLVTGVTLADVQLDSSDNPIVGSGGTLAFDGLSPVNLEPCPTPGSCDITTNATSCRHFTGSYTPSVVSGGTNACSFTFKDKVTATGDLPSFAPQATVTGSGPAVCALCACGQ